MGANFTPVIGPYKNLQPFRFWCQHVLPLVYDDSLSYYELLTKVVDYINNIIADVNIVESNMQSLLDSYNQLQNYVNDYFSNIDIQSEINNKLDEMATDGTLSNLVAPVITAWLTENIDTNIDGYVVDKSLTVANAAADAKYTGIAIKKERDRAISVENKKINSPLNGAGTAAIYGNPGQILRTLGNGNTEWVDPSSPTSGEIQTAVNTWMEENPSDRALIDDGSITQEKLSAALLSKVDEFTTIDEYEYLVDPVTNDWTVAVNTALSEHDCVIINKDIQIFDTVTIGGNNSKTLIIMNVTITKPETANNSNPMFYLNRNYATLIGFGSASRIICKTDTFEDGIVKVGHPSPITASSTDKAVEWFTVANLDIEGRPENASQGIIGGNTSNYDNTALNLCGTYYNGENVGAWLGMIQNLTICHATIGVHLNNAVSGNMLSNFVFYDVGNHKTNGAFVFDRQQGRTEEPDEAYEIILGPYHVTKIPFDNVISNAFHHGSPNAATICFRSVGKQNTVTNIICEQGGHGVGMYGNPAESVYTSSSSRNIVKFGGSPYYPFNLDITNSWKNNTLLETKADYYNSRIYSGYNRIYSNLEEVYIIENKTDATTSTKIPLATDTYYNVYTFPRWSNESVNRDRKSLICDINVTVNYHTSTNLTTETAWWYSGKWILTTKGNRVDATEISGNSNGITVLIADVNHTYEAYLQNILWLKTPELAGTISTLDTRISLSINESPS